MAKRARPLRPLIEILHDAEVDLARHLIQPNQQHGEEIEQLRQQILNVYSRLGGEAALLDTYRRRSDTTKRRKANASKPKEN